MRNEWSVPPHRIPAQTNKVRCDAGCRVTAFDEIVNFSLQNIYKRVGMWPRICGHKFVPTINGCLFWTDCRYGHEATCSPHAHAARTQRPRINISRAYRAPMAPHGSPSMRIDARQVCLPTRGNFAIIAGNRSPWVSADADRCPVGFPTSQGHYHKY